LSLFQLTGKGGLRTKMRRQQRNSGSLFMYSLSQLEFGTDTDNLCMSSARQYNNYKNPQLEKRRPKGIHAVIGMYSRMFMVREKADA
jgi:hypothetical protein